MKTKRWLCAALGLVLAVSLALFAACSQENGDGTAEVAVTSVTVTPATLTLTVGESDSLSAQVLPADATDKTVTWSSSDTDIATVADGTVTAVAAGTATITAAAGGKSGSCTVTVEKAVVWDVWDGETVSTDWYNEEDTSFTLSGAADLAGFAKLVNERTESFEGKTVELAANIDLNGENWTPVGTTSAPFCGTFDGNGFGIRGIERDNAAAETPAYDGALFVCLSGAEVRDLTVSASVRTNGWAGILAGLAQNTKIENVAVEGSIAGVGEQTAVAGLCEYLSVCEVSGCVNRAAVTSEGVAGVSQYAAGIACEVNRSTVKNCTNGGTVTVDAGAADFGAFVGGIAAYIKNGSALTGSTNAAAVSVTEGFYCEIGGIVGEVYLESAGEMEVSGNANSGAVSATADNVYIGGIAGAVYTVGENSSGYWTNRTVLSGNENEGEIAMTVSEAGDTAVGNRPAAGGIVGWATTMNGSFVQENNVSSVTPVNNSERGVVGEVVGELYTVE